MKKKSDTLNSSVELEDSGLGLKVRMIQRPQGNNLGFNKEIKIIPSLSQASWEHNNLLVFGQTTSINTPAKPIEQDSEIKNSTKEILEISEQSKFLSLTFLQQDFPAKVFPLPENVKVFRIEQGELFSSISAGSLEIKDQATYSLRMLRDYFHTMEAEPLQLYSFYWMNLGMMQNGKSSTLNIGCPKTGKGSLSSVLEDEVDDRYYLSKKMIDYLKRHVDGRVLPLENDEAYSLTNTDYKGVSKQRFNVIQKTSGQSITVKKDEVGTLQAGGANVRDKIPNIICDSGHNRKYQKRNNTIPPLRANTGADRNNLLIANAVDVDGYLRRGKKDRNKDGKAMLTSIAKRRIRRLTPRECERLQGFPDDWTKECSDTQRYKQMGNAVSVPVITAIGKKIIEVINA